MKVITWLTHKGGEGKTMFACHLAAGLAARGYRVVLVDADGQGHSTIMWDIPKSGGFYDLIKRDAPYSDVLRAVAWEQYAKQEPSSGFLWVVPGNDETMGLDNLADVTRIRDRFRDLEDDVDFVIVDTPADSITGACGYLSGNGLFGLSH